MARTRSPSRRGARLALLALLAPSTAWLATQSGPDTAPPAAPSAEVELDQGFGTRAIVGPLPGPRHGEVPQTSNPLGDEAKARAQGRQLFNQFNCSGCHGGHAGGGMGPSLRDQVWIYGGSPQDIFDSIAEGRAHGMPAWGPLLPDSYIWSLVAYIDSLRTPDEPEPPR